MRWEQTPTLGKPQVLTGKKRRNWGNPQLRIEGRPLTIATYPIQVGQYLWEKQYPKIWRSFVAKSY